MAASSLKPMEEEEERAIYQNMEAFLSTLPQEKGWISEHLYQYKGFWYNKATLQGTIAAQQHFKARASDIFLVTYPKSGTTWIKTIAFAIMNRTHYNHETHPLLSSSPHECVPFLEFYANENPTNPNPGLPLLATHIPYTSLPDSMLASGCRIVYVYRDPKDVLVSFWHFACKLRAKELRAKELQPLSLEEMLEQFAKGVSPYGPYWDHVLRYWKASSECPHRVLFIKYDEMKIEPDIHVKRLADFMGQPFSLEEERDGAVHEITKLCSFENLSNLAVNKTGKQQASQDYVVSNNVYFRRGQVGDWKSHLTEEMVERLDQITKQKLKGTGLVY